MLTLELKMRALGEEEQRGTDATHVKPLEGHRALQVGMKRTSRFYILTFCNNSFAVTQPSFINTTEWKRWGRQTLSGVYLRIMLTPHAWMAASAKACHGRTGGFPRVSHLSSCNNQPLSCAILLSSVFILAYAQDNQYFDCIPINFGAVGIIWTCRRPI